jgi:hypothetical protein
MGLVTRFYTSNRSLFLFTFQSLIICIFAISIFVRRRPQIFFIAGVNDIGVKELKHTKPLSPVSLPPGRNPKFLIIVEFFFLRKKLLKYDKEAFHRL